MLKRDVNKGLNITLLDVKNDIRQTYTQYNTSNPTRKERGENLMVANGNYKCTCNNCGKIGHKSTNCWTLDKNKDERPRSFKNK
jgi:hypothetical protein